MNTRITPFTELEVQIAQDALRKGETIIVQIGSGSMYPILRVGDKVEITRKVYQRSDLVAVWTQQIVLVHRLMEVQDTKVVLHGDNNAASTAELFSQDDVLGVVTRIIPGKSSLPHRIIRQLRLIKKGPLNWLNYWRLRG